MKRAMLFARLAIATGCFALTGRPAGAADHMDGGTGLDNNPSADLADLYVWPSADRSTLTLIMTLNGPVAEDVQYVFHVARQGNVDDALMQAPAPGEVTEILCRAADGGTQTQCWAGDPSNGGDYVEGDATPTTGNASNSGMLRVHVGTHADPFFHFVSGLTSTLAAINVVAGSNPDANLGLNEENYPDLLDGAGTDANIGTGCNLGATTTGGEVLAGILAGSISYSTVTGCDSGASPTNELAGNDIDAIVVELDMSLIAGATNDRFLQVWASTHSGG
jgi:hypothetical protein